MAVNGRIQVFRTEAIPWSSPIQPQVLLQVGKLACGSLREWREFWRSSKVGITYRIKVGGRFLLSKAAQGGAASSDKDKVAVTTRLGKIVRLASKADLEVRAQMEQQV